MTRKEALQDLLVKVKAGNAPEYSPFREAYVKTYWQAFDMKDQGIAWKAYNGSMDAALSLHEAVLPGWTWHGGQNAHHRDVTMWVRKSEDGAVTLEFNAYAATPSRALLIALLEALVAKDGDA